MTTKRMFSNDIVGSDAFLEMPSTTQSLYFHLGMRCDDDGFVNPNVTMRMIGANKNDLDILIAKRFLLLFKNGVVVIKHHRINNKWDSRDSRRTLYTEELKSLFIKENNSYTLEEELGESVVLKYPKITKKIKQLEDSSETRRDSADRIEENKIEENKIEKKKGIHIQTSEIKLPQKKEYGEFCEVKLTDSDYAKLVERFGEDNTKILIAELDTGIASKGYKYKNHYATLLNWARRKFQERKDKIDSKTKVRTLAVFKGEE